MRKKLASEELAKVLTGLPLEIDEKASSRVDLTPEYQTGLAGKYTLALLHSERRALLCHYST